MDSNNAVEATGLVKRYGETTALDAIDLEVPTGTVTAVLGPNGAGKTTAVRILTSLRAADEGHATVAGFDVRTQGTEVRRRIGLAAQEATVDRCSPAGRTSSCWASCTSSAAARRKSRATELLASSRSSRPPIVSPGATRAGCDAASTWPRPSSAARRSCSSTSRRRGSTPGAAAELWTVLDMLVDFGTTVVLTTQYLEEAERLADDIVVIDHGRVIARGDARKLKREVGGDQVQVVVIERAAWPRRPTSPPSPATSPWSTPAPARWWRRPAGARDPRAGGAALTDARIAVDDLSLRQPTLDEVFLTITGSQPDPTTDDDGRQFVTTAKEASWPSSRPPRPPRHTPSSRLAAATCTTRGSSPAAGSST